MLMHGARPQLTTVPDSPEAAAPNSSPISRHPDRTDRESHQESNREYREAFGIRIRLARTARRLTQDELAARAGVTRNYISAIERGKQNVDLVRLRQIADAFEVSLPALVADDVDLISLVLFANARSSDRVPAPLEGSAPPAAEASHDDANTGSRPTDR